MRWIGTVAREAFGLFVDDGSFAVAILAWLAVVGLVLSRIEFGAGWAGLILFAGLALILVESATRRAGR